MKNNPELSIETMTFEDCVRMYKELKKLKGTIKYGIDKKFFFSFVDIMLDQIENSIPKKKVEKKIKELSNTKGDFATYIATRERIKELQELLEEE